MLYAEFYFFFFFQAEDGIRDLYVTGVQTCALPICLPGAYDAREVQLERTGAGSALPRTGTFPGGPQILVPAVRAVERHLTLAAGRLAHTSSPSSARRAQVENCSPSVRSAR